MNDKVESANQNLKWQSWQVYVMAAVCLLVGVMVGYLVRGSAPVAATPVTATQSAPGAPAAAQQKVPTLDDMKRMADKQAEPLLKKLKTDPNNADLLNQVGNIYRMTHQFQTAATYYQK